MALSSERNAEDFVTIFIFPFTYNWNLRRRIHPVDAADELVGGNGDPEKGWVVSDFDISIAGDDQEAIHDSLSRYAEFFYFRPFVRKAIFSGMEDDGSLSGRSTRNAGRNHQMMYLERKDVKGLQVCLPDQKSQTGINEIRSVITSVGVHLFDNQLGLMFITTEKGEESDLLDKALTILKSSLIDLGVGAKTAVNYGYLK